MRQKPNDGDKYYWYTFDSWADEEGLGTAWEDWEMWWQCWKAAIEECWLITN